MSNINLSTYEKKAVPSKGDRGIKIVIGIFVLVILVWAGLYFTRLYLVRQTETAKAENKEISENAGTGLLSDSAKDVVDFQIKSEIAKKSMEKSRSMTTQLNAIQNTMLSSVYLESFSYDDAKGIVTVNCVTGNYTDVANQIASFKKNFDSVVAGTTSNNRQTGRIAFTVEFTAK